MCWTPGSPPASGALLLLCSSICYSPLPNPRLCAAASGFAIAAAPESAVRSSTSHMEVRMSAANAAHPAVRYTAASGVSPPFETSVRKMDHAARNCPHTNIPV